MFHLISVINCSIYACLLLTTSPFYNSGCISASRPDRFTPGERARGILYLIIIKRKMFPRQRTPRKTPPHYYLIVGPLPSLPSNRHTYRQTFDFIYTDRRYYSSHMHVEILSLPTEQTRYTETKYCSLVHDPLHNLRS
jgi:hypothetical protein